MKSIHCGLFLIVGLYAVILTGCTTTSSSQYEPVDPPTYARFWDQSVAVAEITDRRPGLEPVVYYFQDKDKGMYDRPVASIVGDVVEVELQRAGLKLDHTNPDVRLNCVIKKFRAQITERDFQPSELEMLLVLRFRWIDPKTDAVLEENVRRMRRHRKLGSSEVVALPFDSGQIRSFGEELLNDMLPRVIEKEMTLNTWLARQGPSGQTVASSGSALKN